MPVTGPAPESDFIDLALGERYYRDQPELEARLTDELIGLIRQAITKRFEDGRRPALRDAHAFDNGCVKAIFRVDADLDPSLRHGVFVPGREYRAWIRFSNGNSERRPRFFPDARGMAIKLMDVPGRKLSDDEAGTQDFILISHPVFFVDDLERYNETLRMFLKGSVFDQFVRALLKLRGREIWLALVVNLRWIANPLLHQHWSMTPYRLGIDPASKRAVKYIAKPRSSRKRSGLARVLTYLAWNAPLKRAVNKTLKREEASFDFYVQPFVDERRTPIEDSKVEWKEDVAKLLHVATIIIPPQNIMSKEQRDFCENLSFNPWHSLPEHKPLGLVNRVRKSVYVAISKHRHDLNKTPRVEPAGHELPSRS